ncbi:AAA family ATPase [Telmatobacter bradus]|uniref:AAA family ATPase n=1 Tax=Telmatobacter bradus TaxID=474953 RepID=UPI003B43084C
MRKLTVKNFSVIEDAELEFGKITVLIGPQASGKSLLCKLAYFCGQAVPELIESCFSQRLSFASLLFRIQNEFLEKFSEESWRNQNFLVVYVLDNFSVSFAKSSKQEKLSISLQEGLRNFYSENLTGNRVILPSGIRKQLLPKDTGPLPLVEDSTYVPTGRAFYSLPNRGYAALATKNLDWITQLYASQFDAEYKALMKCYQSDLGALRAFGELVTTILKGKVIREEGRLLFESNQDIRKWPFEILSSGTLELLPLINSLSQSIDKARYSNIPTMPAPPLGMFFIEEPELGVFPNTQNDLVRLLAWFANFDSLWLSYAITTHSPYILSAFNNLILAGQLGQKAPLKKKIPIDEKYWIAPGTFKAYSIHDGKLESILSDSGLINGEYLDDVSETIGHEFDELLRLEYANQKVS